MAKINNNIEQENERYDKYLHRSNSRKTIMKAKQQQMMLENSTKFRNISSTVNCESGYEELDESEANIEEIKMILQQRKIEIEKVKIQNEFQKQEKEMKQLKEQRNKKTSLSTTSHSMSQDLIKQLSSLHISLASLIQKNPIPTSAITTANTFLM